MILLRKELIAELGKVENNSKTIVFTNGCFDLLHMGHVDYLNKAKALGSLLIVGLNSDNSIRRLKGEKRPIVEEMERAFILDNLKSVDFVTIFDEDTPYELIDSLKPNVLVKGADYIGKIVVGEDLVKKNNGVVKLIEFIDGCSSTEIINRIKERYSGEEN
jgi:rfaE bifunctional protein nucleotidyltransferase chain/domain